MPRLPSLICAALLTGVCLRAGVSLSAGNLTLTLDERQGTIQGISFHGRALRVTPGQALFHVRDIQAGPEFYAVTGPLRREGGVWVLTGSAAKLELTGRIAIRRSGDLLAMDAVFSSARAAGRGLVVTLTVPLAEDSQRWSGDLIQEVTPQPGGLYGSNVTPVSAVRNAGASWGMAAAIPPGDPVSYDTHYQDGVFGLYFYVGLSPHTKAFPNQARVAALLYGIDPKWGFRSAIDKYYDAFPEFYRVRASSAGAWCFHMNAAKDELGRKTCTFFEAGGEELELVPGTDSLPSAGYESKGYFVSKAWTPREWAEKNSVPEAIAGGISVFPYTIVGQRQIYMLPGATLIKDYDEAMRTLAKWAIEPAIPFQNPALANGFRSVDEIKEIIRNSGLHDRQDRLVFLPRFYTGNTLTFPLNPSPALFADAGKMTIARYSLDYYVPYLLNALPGLKGIYVDSMGRWNNFLNYRVEHFAYATHPLDVDAGGNPVMRNLAPHYDYLAELGKRLHAGNRLLFANGISEAGAKAGRNGKTDFDAARPTSRFFLAALADVASAESGAGTSIASMAARRVSMGPKPYALLAKSPAAEARLETYFRRGVAMGIFASLGDLYYRTPELRRFAARLGDLYLPLMRMLHQAGWRPVRGIDGLQDVFGERFGTPGRGRVFLTLYNDGTAARQLALHLDRDIFGSAYSAAADRASQSSEAFRIGDSGFAVRVNAGQLRVIEFTSGDR